MDANSGGASSGVDIIGDIHGMYARLTELLGRLGYRRTAGRWTHAENRRIAFVGDYVDRGRRASDVVELVRELCDHRVAVALAGNHDTNAIAFSTRAADRRFDAVEAWREASARLAAGGGDAVENPPGSATWLRPHTIGNLAQHKETIHGFRDARSYEECLRHFMTLPIYLELPALRVVHAAWIPPAIRALDAWAAARGLTLGIRATSIDEAIEMQRTRVAPGETHWGELVDLGERQQALDHPPDASVAVALERLVKGVELRLPDGVVLHDGSTDRARGEARLRWFDAAEGRPYHQHALMKPSKLRDLLAALGERRILASEYPARLPPLASLIPYEERDAYPSDAQPVLFGHYSLFDREDREFGKVLRANVGCVDSGGGYGLGRLSAYRWSGERELAHANFVAVDAPAD